MKQTCVLPNATRSTKLRGAQHSPKLAFRSIDFCLPENLIFPALVKNVFLQRFQEDYEIEY